MNRILSFLFVILIATSSHAQSWQWAEKIGDAGADIGMSVKTGQDGTIYLTGLFESSATFGSTVLTGNGSYDMFFSKLDSSGNVLWAQQTGGQGADYGTIMIPDSAGNFYVMGAFEDSLTLGSYSFLSSGLRDMMIAKFDAGNNVIWAKKIGGTGTEDPYSIQIDKWGNIYAVLSFEGVMNLGPMSLTATGGFDIALVKFDNNGNVVWAKKEGGMGADVPESVDVDDDGNIYIGGHFSDACNIGSYTLNCIGLWDVFYAKYDSAGTVQWARSAGGPGGDGGTIIKVDHDKNIFLTGTFENTMALGTNQLTSDGDLDVFIAKCDSNGNFIWARHCGSTLTELVNTQGMTIDNAGNIYVTGFYGNPATFGTISINGYYDVFVAKYDTSGTVVWVKSATGTGGIYNQVGYGCAVRNGAVYITGSFATDLSFNNSPFTLYSAGSDDIYLAKIGNSLTAVDEKLAEKAIHVFPNPFNDNISIALTTSQFQNAEISILNSLGQEVFSDKQQVNDGGFLIKHYDLHSLESGVYLLQVKGENTVMTRKIVKN